ncbi:Fe2+-enterobactin ABC transporter substrate-binding protein [Salinivibrio proteolyticus]|uniref:Fe2+-enterobactin ABC transporter substrate-binding protein n=1 Tax=Salinivibrio proteolyticus TaxID=334715 RepID=A0ABY7LEC7_9GAMM|nr:Fe2+-enterobactin ABC transporter substrate-binding protein [Salinivibrio proteolyticus]WBA15588.1 Fe2+-enterobactin ABC transporter substrate-binding protein [Salinivibrio proteolyticus]
MMRHHYARIFTGLLFLTLLSACNDAAISDQQSKPLTVSDGWPKKITSSYGHITLTSPPKRIVSTSVSITGTLLAIDAPVIASGGTLPNSPVADKDGYFYQWRSVANERNVKPLYQGLANAEVVAKERPDLIIVSATGGDSAIKMYDQFSAIAPTLVINYDDKSWQELARLLASFTDRETQAEYAIQRFNHRVVEVKKRIKLPPQPTTAMVYYGDGRGANFWTVNSAQGKVLQALGFELSEIPEPLTDNHQMGQRKDIVPVNGENFADAITGQSILLFAAETPVIQQLRENKFIAHLKAVRDHHVYAMGNDSFRLDYYSSMNLLENIETLFNAR